MVRSYFELGKRIVEHEQLGEYYSNYGMFLLEKLSKDLTKEFGNGYSKRNLVLIKKFYLTYKIAKAPISQSISLTHYLHLMRIYNEDERRFYEIETEKNGWSVRELERQINSLLYERLSISKKKQDVRLEVETVWLIQDQMAQMLGKGRSTVIEPIIYINLFHIDIWNNYFLRFFWCLNYGSR